LGATVEDGNCQNSPSWETSPQLDDQRQHLLHVGNTLVLVHAAHHAVELTLIGAPPDAELQPAARDQVEHGGFARQLDRVPVGRLHHGGAQADVVGVGRVPGQELEGAGRDRHLDGVVLGDPDDLEAAGIGDLHQFQILAGDFGHVLARREARHVDGNGEFHGCGPFAIGLDRASSKHGACGAAR
jgi:hypothetical protein